jgi:tetratricopeptide (TPR) repeat protein
MPAAADSLDRGRESYGRYAWADAFAALSAADAATPLDAEDLVLLATASYLIGRDDDSIGLLERAHHEFLGRGDVEPAARCAFWLAFLLLNGGEAERGGGWVARGRRLLDADGRDCAEQGYLLFAVGMMAIFKGDLAGAYATFGEAAEIGERFGEVDLVTFARHGQGRALIRLGRDAEGKALLDEVMVALTSGAVSPIVVGDVYCSVIQGCEECFDLGRAQAWTAALSHWCAAQPDLVPYRGQCLLHRAEIMQLHGAWQDAIDEVERASERLAQRPGRSAAGAAFYRRGELHRLSGAFAEAEECYRQASRCGASRSPGWPCSGSGRDRSMPRRRRSGASSTRPRASWPARACCPHSSRSCSRPATSTRPRPAPTSSPPWPTIARRRCCGHAPPTPRAPSSSPAATRVPR